MERTEPNWRSEFGVMGGNASEGSWRGIDSWVRNISSDGRRSTSVEERVEPYASIDGRSMSCDGRRAISGESKDAFEVPRPSETCEPYREKQPSVEEWSVLCIRLTVGTRGESLDLFGNTNRHSGRW